MLYFSGFEGNFCLKFTLPMKTQMTCPVLDRTLFGSKLFSAAQAPAKSASTKNSMVIREGEGLNFFVFCLSL